MIVRSIVISILFSSFVLLSQNKSQPKDEMKTLIIFDFSGTLSLEAVRFGEPENLKHALKESGLWELGVNNLELFWEEIINPTWQEGSTTKKGYADIIAESLKKIRSGSGEVDDKMNEQIQKSAGLFTQKYFGASKLHPEWKKLLINLINDSGTCVVLATDNYAEATPHIKSEFKKLGVVSREITEAESESEITSIAWVANSADLGTHKSEQEFWIKVKNLLHPKNISNILVVDDFGANEVTGDIYSAQEKVEKRKYQTAQLMKDAFNVPPKIFTFDLNGKINNSTFSILVEETVEFVEKNASVN